MECEQSDHLPTTTAVVSQSLHLCEQLSLLPASVQVFMCHLLSVTVVREDEYSVPMFQKGSFSQGC